MTKIEMEADADQIMTEILKRSPVNGDDDYSLFEDNMSSIKYEIKRTTGLGINERPIEPYRSLEVIRLFDLEIEPDKMKDLAEKIVQVNEELQTLGFETKRFDYEGFEGLETPNTYPLFAKKVVDSIEEVRALLKPLAEVIGFEPYKGELPS